MSRKPISNRTRFRVFERDDFTCRYCGRRSPEVVLQVDHVEPVSRGGANHMENYATSCRECNGGKGAEPLTLSYRLVDGPLAGEIERRNETYPLLWVYRENSGATLAVPDQWRVTRRGGVSRPSEFPRGGHPMLGHHPHESRDGRPYHHIWVKPYPKLIGFYDSLNAHRELIRGEMWWSDPDDLLLRLTEIAGALEDIDLFEDGANDPLDLWTGEDEDARQAYVRVRRD